MRTPALLLGAVCLAVAGCSAAREAEKAAPTSSKPSATPAVTVAATIDPYPNVPDITCRQLNDAYMSKYDIGMPPNEWGGTLLAALIGADGIETTLTGLDQIGFALDIAKVCLNPDVFDQSARTIGVTLYRANKDEYIPKR